MNEGALAGTVGRGTILDFYGAAILVSYGMGKSTSGRLQLDTGLQRTRAGQFLMAQGDG